MSVSFCRKNERPEEETVQKIREQIRVEDLKRQFLRTLRLFKNSRNIIVGDLFLFTVSDIISDERREIKEHRS